jgi:hypothetical protein
MAAGFTGSADARRVWPGRSCPACAWLTRCCVVAGYGGIPSGRTVSSNSTSRSKFTIPICRIPVIVTVRRAGAPATGGGFRSSVPIPLTPVSSC